MLLCVGLEGRLERAAGAAAARASTVAVEEIGRGRRGVMMRRDLVECRHETHRRTCIVVRAQETRGGEAVPRSGVAAREPSPQEDGDSNQKQAEQDRIPRSSRDIEMPVWFQWRSRSSVVMARSRL